MRYFIIAAIVLLIGISVFLSRLGENASDLVDAKTPDTIKNEKMAPDTSLPSARVNAVAAESLAEKKDAIQLDPVQAEIAALLDAGDYYGALEKVEAHLVKEPNSEWALEVAAMTYLNDLKQSEKANVFFKRLAQQNPEHSFALQRVVEWGYESNKPGDSFEFLEALNKEKPGHAPLAFQLGDIYAQTGRPKEAVPLLEQAVRDERYQLQARRPLAEAYESAGMPNKAAQVYQDSIQYYDAKIDALTDPSEIKFEQRAKATNQLELAKLLIKSDPAKAEELTEAAAKEIGEENSRVRYLRKLLEGK